MPNRPRNPFLAMSALIAALPLLAGCVGQSGGQPGLPDPLPPAPGACGAPALQDLVGQDGSILDRIRLAAPARIIRPGQAVTMDYSPDRLNIELDAANRIQRVYCG